MVGVRTEIVEVELPDGTAIYVEVNAPTHGDVGARSRIFGTEALGKQISVVSSWILSHVRDGLLDKPSNLSVEFGLKFAVKSGNLISVLAEGSGEATVVIKLDWPLGARDAASDSSG